MEHPDRLNLWINRLRWMLLLLAIILGLSLAAFEKWRQDEAWVFWGRVSERLALYLDPLRAKTQNSVQFARKARHLWRIEGENKNLRRDLTTLYLEHQKTLEELSRLKRLSGLGEWTSPKELRFITADVSGMLTSEQGAILIVNRGREDGIQERDPVVALGGLVGLVRNVSAHSAHVQALSDHMSGVGAMISSTRARGVVVGRGRGEPLEFRPENEVQPIAVGDELVTSGFENSVFPKGIVIGQIQARVLGNEGTYFGQVTPAVPFDSVEEVMVVLPRERNMGRDLETTLTLGKYSIEMPRPKPAADPPTSPTLPSDHPSTGILTLESLMQTTESLLLDLPPGMKLLERRTTPTLETIPPPVDTPAPARSSTRRKPLAKPAATPAASARPEVVQ